MRSKDKKTIDRYLEKHPNAKPEKIEEYARSKGIYINVLKELEYQKLMNEMLQDLNLPDNLDLEIEENQILLKKAIDNLPQEKKNNYLKRIR